MNNKLRFTSPDVLSPDTCPIPMITFVQSLPCMGLATRVFGSEAAATNWMCTPALELDQRRPADVIVTDPLLVQNLLIRLEAYTLR